MVKNQEQERLLHSLVPLEFCNMYIPDLDLKISLRKNEENMQMKVSLRRQLGSCNM